MSGVFEGMDDVKNLFKEILGSDVIVSDSMDITEEIIFVVFIQKIRRSFRNRK